MSNVDRRTYRGEVYVRYPGSRHPSQRRYFRRYVPRREGGGVVLLHRKMWEDHRGPIPKGFQVHHRDGNHSRNRLSNFELETSTGHLARHPEQLRRIRRYAGKGTLTIRFKRGLRRLAVRVGLAAPRLPRRKRRVRGSG